MYYTYVTVLNGEAYYPGLCALYYSLKRVRSQYGLTVLIPDTSSDRLREKLKSLGVSTLEVPLLELNKEMHNANPMAHWSNTFFKLQIFNLTQFDKIVYLDLDMIVLQNIDDLFEKKHMSAVAAGKCIYDDWKYGLNSGMLVVEPNQTEYKEILECIVPVCEKLLQEGRGFGDQDILKHYYSDWYERKGLSLDEIYNTLFCCVEEVSKLYGMKSIRIFHYAEAQKPWNMDTIAFVKELLYYLKHRKFATFKMECLYRWFIIRGCPGYRFPKHK